MNTTDCNSGKTHHQRPGALFLSAIVFAAILTAITSCKTKTGNNTDVIGWGLTNFSSKEGNTLKKMYESLPPAYIIDSFSLFGSHEHYLAVKDLVALSISEIGSRVNDDLLDSLLSWRLAVFYPYSDDEQSILKSLPCIYDYKSDFGFHAYGQLHKRIDSLLNYCPEDIVDVFDRSYLELFLAKYYEMKLSSAFNDFWHSFAELREDGNWFFMDGEIEAFQDYVKISKLVGEKVIAGRTWGRWARLGYYDYLIENYKMRSMAMQYSLFECWGRQADYDYSKYSFESLRDCKDVTPEDVIFEYDRFIKTVYVDTVYAPLTECVSTIEECQESLGKEREAWKNWMQARKYVSETLEREGFDVFKIIWDKSTRNLLLRKWIQLNNQFEHLRFLANDMEKCLLKDDCTVKDLRKSCFAERWDKYKSAGN